MRPQTIKQRSAWRGRVDSGKLNIFSNQIFYSITKLFSLFNLLDQAINEDSMKNVDDESTYSDIEHHPFPPVNNNIELFFNSDSETTAFKDVRKTNQQILKLKALAQTLEKRS